MRYGRTLLALLVVAFSATPVLAQSASVAAQDGPLVLAYDVDSDYAVGGLVYCREQGQGGNPFGGPQLADARIKTVGASTTVTSYAAGGNAFTNVAAGDILIVKTPTAGDPDSYVRLVVVAKASDDSITVDATVTLTATGGHEFSFYRTVCGTAATSGWFYVPTGARWLGITLDFEQGDITTLAVRWECRPTNGVGSVILYPGEGADCGPGGAYTAATNTCDFPLAVAGTVNGRLTVVDDAPTFGSCRVGLAYKTADASDAGANREKVSVYVSIR